MVSVFAVGIGGFAVLDNQLYLPVNLLPAQVDKWSDEEVFARWYRIHPPRLNRQPLEITPELLAANATDHQHVAQIRKRLGDLGWFMKSLKEPIARLANEQDSTRGPFWQSRYKSTAILVCRANSNAIRCYQ